MCNFFSFVGDGYGNYLYCDWTDRAKIIKSKSDASLDSHTYILTHNKVPANLQDRWSKYKYNPIIKKFTIDDLVNGHDSEAAQNWCEALNFGTIVPALIVKPIVDPLLGKAKKVTPEIIKELTSWTSVWASIRASVGASVRDPVGDSVEASVWTSVWVFARDSAKASARASARASVWAYISSFFRVTMDYDLSSAIKLWNEGFVPSFDGTTWRLQSGKDAKIVYEWVKE